MSFSNVSNDSIAALHAIHTESIMFTRYWCIIMFVVGFIGHSLNLCVFTRRAFRFNSCIRYLMASTIGGYLIILIILPVLLLQFGYNLSLFVPSIITCKILTFLFSWIRILPCWFIALASVDRYFCSSLSTLLRSWSSIHVSTFLIILSVILVGMSQIPMLIYYQIHSQPIICLGKPNSFQKLNGIFILIIWSLIPSFAMLVFGLLTIRHIRRSVQKAIGSHVPIQRRKRTKFIDRQLIQITLIQSILFGITSAAGAIGGMYNVIDNRTEKNPLTLAKQGFIGNILSFVGLLSPCISFYLCTLSSQLFRHVLTNLFRHQEL